jgi:hypothetical protein
MCCVSRASIGHELMRSLHGLDIGEQQNPSRNPGIARVKDRAEGWVGKEIPAVPYIDVFALTRASHSIFGRGAMKNLAAVS